MTNDRRHQALEKYEREVLDKRVRGGYFEMGDRRFQVRTTRLIVERLIGIENALLARPTQVRKKRPPTAWQEFFAAGMKAGKTPAEIGAEWRAR